MRYFLLLAAGFLATFAAAEMPKAPSPPTAVSQVQSAEKSSPAGDEGVPASKPSARDWANLHQYYEADKQLAGHRVDVVFLGDSITNRWAMPKQSHFMQDHGYIGRGITSQVTGQMLLRMPQDVLDLHPKVLVLLGGTNDLNHLDVPDMEREVEENITMIADLALMHHIRIILCSITPVNDDHANRTTTRPPQTILKINAFLKLMAEKRGLQYVDYYSALQDGHDRMKSSYTQDGLHPNPEAFKIMEPLVEKAIEVELK